MNVWRRLSGPRRTLALAGAGVLVAGGLVTIPVTAAQAATQCDVAYSTNEWPGGFTASITLKNLGDPVNGWTLGWTFPNSGQRVQQGWSAEFTQSGSQVTARSLSYNGSLATGASISLGFNGAWSGSNPKPTSFTLNGVTCNGGTTPPTTPPPTTPPPTNPPPAGWP
ncbi:cellulose 1,4-beta-cellobiosidase, partial [Micromonospora acroterricola]